MKVTIEITKRYTFVADVVHEDEAEKIRDQLLNGSRSLNYPITLPDNVFFRGAELDGAITFVKIG